ncbi:NXPE family member 3-like [Heteronotia binoei]|uniref:NXPE family member 3-like n=1 Tax=Heteronotia binoei TaxID=13085 RepID=UPI00292E02D5|nr:NXPE family member 3-like [Heteronotia binoei]XP_060112448.1 NXPE family member 3-like [Heteronotia binoei]
MINLLELLSGRLLGHQDASRQVKNDAAMSVQMVSQFPSIQQSSSRVPPPLPRGIRPSQALSPEAEELQRLLPLLEWPAPPWNAGAFDSSTSPKKSHYQLWHPQHNYTMGNTLLVVLEARDHCGQPKPYGGDFFQAKVHSPELKASVAGTVEDHRNGTYTLAFPLLWVGAVQVSVSLIHSSEAVALLRHVRHSQPSTVAFWGYYVKPGQLSPEERTECNVHPLPGPTCQYADAGTGERWFCAQPQHLPCSALVYHSAGLYKDAVSKTESAFLGRCVQETREASSPPRLCRPGLAPAHPPGFYYRDVWVSLECSSRTFPTPDLVLGCLRGKVVHMMGDSTLRQWWEFLVAFIPSLKQIDYHATYQSGPLLAVEPEAGLVLWWRAHGVPLRTQKTKMADLHYVANELNALGGGPDVVVVFTICAHFTTFPLELYVRRLHQVREAVTQLLARSPSTTIVIKTANTGYLSVYGSDWLSMQLDSILRAMFAGLPVAVVDAWAMTACHYLPRNIHPGKVIVRNEVDSFLSFVCPKA